VCHILVGKIGKSEKTPNHSENSQDLRKNQLEMSIETPLESCVKRIQNHVLTQSENLEYLAMRMDDPTWSIRHEGESLFSIFMSLIKLIEGAFRAGLDEEKAIGVPVFTSYSASFTNLLNDLVELMNNKDFENASKLFDGCSLLKTNNSRFRDRRGDSPDKYRYTFSNLTLADVLVMDYDMTALPMFTIPFKSMLNETEEMTDEYVAIARLLLKRRVITKEMFASLPIPLGLSERGGV
jgi:hypothetical protein